MKLLDRQAPSEATRAELASEALFREAKQRERRRRLGIALAVLVVAGAGATAAEVAGGGGRSGNGFGSGQAGQAHSTSAKTRRSTGAAGTTPVVPPGIFVMGLISPTEGWAANGREFEITRDEGNRWELLHPPALRGDLATSLGAVASYGKDDLWVATIGGEEFGTCGHWESPANPHTPVYSTGTIDRSTDAGRTWTSVKIPDCGIVTSLSFPNATDGFAIGPANQQKQEPDRGRLYRTRDGGRTWKVVGSTPFGGSVVTPSGGSAIDFPSAREGFGTSSYGTTPGHLYRTTDGGRTWQRVALPIPRTIDATSTLFGQPQFFSTQDGVVPALLVPTGIEAMHVFVVFTTHDGGMSWKAVIAPHDSGLRAYPTHGDVPFSASSARTWFVFVGPKLYRTSDAGRHWTTLVPYPRRAEGSIFEIDFASNKLGWLIANGSFVVTSDGGRTWKPIGSS